MTRWGVVLAIKNSIPSKLLNTPSDLELLVVTVSLTEITTACLIYNPPNSSTMYHTCLLNYLHSLSSCSNIIIVGDLNLPDANWDIYTGLSSFTQEFCEAAFDLNLLQLVNKPTHRGENILDIILTNQPNITNVSILSVLPCSLKSDHFIINFDITSTPTHEVTENHKSYPIYNYDRADWDAMNDYLTNFNFQAYFNSIDVNFLWESLKSVIFDCIDLFVP